MRKSKIVNRKSKTCPERSRRIENAYTDAPELHPNLILGSLQLLFWLFFHPSAWRNHVARIDPDLRPDFCLAELSWAQWRKPALRRLLVQGYVVLPALVGLLIGLELWLVSQPIENIASVIAGGVAFSVAVGLVSSVAVSLVGGVAVSLVGTVVGVAGVVAGSAAFGLAFAVAGQTQSYSRLRQIGGVVAGVLIGSVVFSVASSVAGQVRSYSSIQYMDSSTRDIWGNAIGWGIMCSVMSTVAVGVRARNWGRALLVGLAFGTMVGVVVGVAIAVASNVTVGVASIMAAVVFLGALLGMWFALPYVLAERMAGPVAGMVAGGLGGGGGWVVWIASPEDVPWWPTLPLGLAGVLLALGLSWWGPVVMYPLQVLWNFALLRADGRRLNLTPRPPSPPGKGERFSSLLRLHSAFWDEHQWLRLIGLDEHLVLVMEHNPAEGQAAMEYLATSRQRWAAQAAQIELDARRLERCASVMSISRAHRRLAAGELEGPVSALLRGFSRVSQDVAAALRQESTYNQRLALSAVGDRLDGLLRELTRSSEPYAARFRPIANQWRQIVADYVRELAQAVETRQEIDNPYIIGVPLTEQQEIFVGRTDVSARIEGLLLDRRRPPLLLYGQRRMGKTSLLNNLGRLLPSTIIPLFVDLQGPASLASDQAGFLYNLAEAMLESARRQRGLALPALTYETLAGDPFTRFNAWLGEVERALEGNTALLALDEFEALDKALSEGRFKERAVLSMLRHIIQHRPRFKVLLAGSHTLEELQRWASYLINMQAVHVGYLKEDEACQLIERPVEGFALRYEPEARQRVLALTRCHPFLVQLLCAEIVALKNEQEPAARRLARLADVEAAVPEALNSGSFFFADIQHNQVDAAGLAALRFLAAQGEGAVAGREALADQFPDGLEEMLDLLIRRELIEGVEGGYRFQVELIRRWFARL